jgi:O-antigen ligase
VASSAVITSGARPQRFVRIIATTGACAIGLAFLTHWPTYSYVVRGGALPLYYYMAALVIAAALFVVDPARTVRPLNDAVTWWFIIYVVLGLAWLLLAQDFPDIAEQQWRTRVLAFVLFATVLTTSSLSNARVVALLIILCMIAAGVLNWYDAVFPSRLVPVGFPGANPGRGAGLFINANGAAAFVLMAAIAALAFTPMWARASVLLAAVVAVAPTFSRFGWLFAIVIVITAFALKLLDRRQMLVLALAVPLIAAGAGVYYQFMLASGNENIIGRLAWFQSFGGEYDFSMRERAFVAQLAWERFLENPLIGNGIGSTLSKGARVGTHNMYLMLMAEQGLFGLALYVSLIAVVAVQGWNLAWSAVSERARDIGRAAIIYALFLAAYGFVNHNVLDEPHGMFILAFMVAGFQGRCRSPDVLCATG